MKYQVVNISTTTQRYVANGILTHNYVKNPSTIECPSGTTYSARTIDFKSGLIKPKIFYQSSYIPSLPITITISSNTAGSANYFQIEDGPSCAGTQAYPMVKLQFQGGRTTYSSTFGISTSGFMTYQPSFFGWQANNPVSFSVQTLGNTSDGTFYWQAVMIATDASGRSATNRFPFGEYSYVNGSIQKNCLTPDTLLELYDGKNVFLKDINVGDSLLSIDPETMKYEESIVTSKSFHEVEKLYLLNNGLIRCSDSHKHVIKRNGEWSNLTSEELILGDIVINKNLEEIVIDSIHVFN
jgi:hypothetical protein